MDETYLICLRLDAVDTWFAWASSDSGNDYFRTVDDLLLWSSDRQSLASHIRNSDEIDCIQETAYLDLDSYLNGLKRGLNLDSDLAINIWNLLTDLENSIGGTTTDLFGTGVTGAADVYERLFSLSSAGEIVGLPATSLQSGDLLILTSVFTSGCALFRQCISEGCKAQPAA